MKPRIAIPVPTLSDHDYNRRSWPAYADAVRAAGGEPVEVSLSAPAEELVAIAADSRGFVFPGSPADVDPARYGHERIAECNDADPAREAVDLFLLEHAYHFHKPVFGICFGAQMLNVYRGGTMVQDLSIKPTNHSAGKAVAVAHVAAVAPDSILGGIVTEHGPSEAPLHGDFLHLSVNSSHHQALGAPGDGLRVTARSLDDGVIEAVEGGDPEHYVLAVQWHPERSTEISAASRSLFARIVREAEVWKPVQE